MFKFTPRKAIDVDEDKFISALNCARDSIESVLHEDGLSAMVVNDKSIVICSVDQVDVNMTLSECKKKIRQCFVDSADKMYPEFGKIDSCASAT